jgi:hypothetical protein
MASKSIPRIVTLIGAALTGIVATFTGINAQAEEQTVTVCIEFGVAQEAIRAQVIAGKMFDDIGIKINWHEESKCSPGQDGVIHIGLNTGVSADRYPGALAIALPYEGAHIQVFVDRLRRLVIPKIVPILLAHVLAHEITHILQGVNRHSESGVMKAIWDQQDYEKMAWKPLSFTDGDVRLIHFGLQARIARGAQASQLPANYVPALAAQ